MKIGISSATIEPALNKGHVDGIGRYTEQLFVKLPSIGVNTYAYACPPFRGKGDFQLSNAFPMSNKLYALLSITPFKFAPKIDESIDLFHFTDYKAIPMNCPVVSTIHDVMYCENPEWQLNKFKAFLVKSVIKRSIKYCDHLIADSEYTAHEILRHLPVGNKEITVVPQGIASDWLIGRSLGEKESVKSKYSIDGEYVLNVGTIQPRKNIDRIIDAFTSLPLMRRKNLCLVIVGKYGWNSEETVKKIQRYVASGEVVWLQNVDSNEDLKVLYQAAKLVLFPSLSEGFGVPILEAFASRVPIITSNCTSMPEICGDAGIKVNPYSTEELADAISMLLTDERACKELIELGYERVQGFSEENMLKKTVEVYQKLI